MLYNTVEAQPASAPSISRRQILSRNSSSMASRPKTSSLALTNITKTISNYFFRAEKLPVAMQERMEPKIIAKPFYTKNRKLICMKSKQTNPVPNGFKNILRAKSTVIKQKKLQEFYINREGRVSDEEKVNFCDFASENSKSNLFRSNVPFKKARHRSINSMNLERRNQINTKEDKMQMPGKAMTIHALTQDITEMALKERKLTANNIEKQKQGDFEKQNWHNFRKRKRGFVNKQNIEFLIEPWNGNDNDDILF